MTKSMRTTESRRLHAGTRRTRIEDVIDCGRLDRSVRRAHAKKQPPLAGFGGSLA